MKKKSKTRRRYAPPKVSSEKMLERSALVCGQKTGSPRMACRNSPST